jgi:hypothetical protein
MIKRLFNKIMLWLKPPKKGDIYYADSLHFVVGKPIEHILHGLKDKYGQSIWTVMQGKCCYRLTIETDVMPYYTCRSEVFCYGDLCNNNIGEWMKRTQPKRISKEYFKQLIVEGFLWKL